MSNIDTHSEAEPLRPTWLVVLTIVAMWGVVVGFMLVQARKAEWTLGWFYLGLFFAGNGVFHVTLLIWNRDLLSRRLQYGSGTKVWDIVWMLFLGPTFFAIAFVAVNDLDIRVADQGSTGIVWLVGLAIYVIGWTLFTWCSVVNPFFEKMVRIQKDAGHHVIDRGPYAFIRHPGYVGFISAIGLSTPPLLPSFSICILSLIVVLLFLARTALEDRTLQAELPGYREYAGRVRYRLVPGVW